MDSSLSAMAAGRGPRPHYKKRHQAIRTVGRVMVGTSQRVKGILRVALCQNTHCASTPHTTTIVAPHLASSQRLNSCLACLGKHAPACLITHHALMGKVSCPIHTSYEQSIIDLIDWHGEEMGMRCQGRTGTGTEKGWMAWMEAWGVGASWGMLGMWGVALTVPFRCKYG
jgi:hypothetical protein